MPDEATIHGLRVAMVVAGIGATLPMFLLGAQISVGRGLRLAVPACFAACALVGLLGTLTSIVGSLTAMTLTGIFGFRVMERFVRVTVPLWRR